MSRVTQRRGAVVAAGLFPIAVAAALVLTTQLSDGSAAPSNVAAATPAELRAAGGVGELLACEATRGAASGVRVEKTAQGYILTAPPGSEALLARLAAECGLVAGRDAGPLAVSGNAPGAPLPPGQEGRASLGLSVQDGAGGALVTQLLAGSSTAAAGMQVGDVITAIGGVPITSGASLVTAVLAHAVGDHVVVAYQRAGQPLTTSLVLGAA